MYCSLPENQLFDDAGIPLSNGRVTVYAKGSDTTVSLFVNSGNEFVPALNPYPTANDGRIPTLFWNAALVDVKVEKNNGNGTYAEVDTFVAGIDYAQLEAAAGVVTISDLKSIKPSAGMVVDVNGYYVAGDCPPRKYLWVPNASNADDGGYIIASLVDNGGRWLMLWESETLPVSIYGVMLDNLTNINNALNYPNRVTAGSVTITTPKVALLDKSDGSLGYQFPSGAEYTSTKVLSSVGGAQYSYAKFTCVEYLPPAGASSFHANIVPTGDNATIRSWDYGASYLDFIAAAQLSNVKKVIFDKYSNIWDSHTSDFTGSITRKLVFDFTSSRISNDFDFSESIVIMDVGIKYRMLNKKSLRFDAGLFGTFDVNGSDKSLSIGVLGHQLMLYLAGKIMADESEITGVSKATYFESDVFRFNAHTPGMSKDPSRNVPMFQGLSVATYGKPINIGTNPSSNLGYPVINISSALDMTAITSDNYIEGDVVLVTNTTASGINVFYGISSDKKTAVLNPYQGCFFYCVYSGASNSQWVQCAPA